MQGYSQLLEQGLDLCCDLIAHAAELFRRQVAGIGNLPVVATAGTDSWAGITASHGHRYIDFLIVVQFDAFGAVPCQIITQLCH